MQHYFYFIFMFLFHPIYWNLYLFIIYYYYYCVLFKIKSYPMHLRVVRCLCRVYRGALLVAHRHSFAPLCCRTSQYRRTFVPLSVSLWNDLSDPVLDGVGLAGFKSRAKAFLFVWSALSFLSPTIIFFFLPLVFCVGLWSSDWYIVLTLSRPCNADSS